MQAIKPFYVLHSRDCTVLIRCERGKADILYWGQKLASSYADNLAQLATRQEAPAAAEREAPLSLSPEFGAAYIGDAGLQIHREGQQWGTNAELVGVEAIDQGLCFISRCSATDIEVEHSLQLDYTSNVLSGHTRITNISEKTLEVLRCNAPCFAVPDKFNQIIGFEGRWAHEFQLQQLARFNGSYVRENRAGRTSHHTFPGVVLHTEQSHELAGEAYGFHLGWSGNHRTAVESSFEGRSNIQMGELFYPGEIRLAPNESYQSPTLYGAFSAKGFSALSRNFHRYVRSHLVDARMQGKTKPVHFNTWEAMYFDFDIPKLYRLAEAAADVGVERFVLDDGWFNHRRNDKAGLGDWYVEADIFPQGLGDLIEHVNECGMEFGLWVEPEMVNPDSDLYRAHPDWILQAPNAPLQLARNQLVLDLTRPEVEAYLYARLDAILTEYPQIAYLKWDMNRDLSQPGGHNGQVAVHKQTTALYAMLDKLRQAHPLVEIESCASGGGRADYGILQYTDRVWTSDSNDAIDRLRIQRGFSFFFPPEFMGAHVGPRDCHITGRVLSMAMRAGVAMFGDMGIEANVLEMDDDEKAELKAAVALHKQHRELILGGDLIRFNLPEKELAFGVVAADKSEALFEYAQLASHRAAVGGRFYFQGLQANANYRLRLIWPRQPLKPTRGVLDVVDGQVFSGEGLMQMGMQLPIMHPDTLLVFYLERQD